MIDKTAFTGLGRQAANKAQRSAQKVEEKFVRACSDLYGTKNAEEAKLAMEEAAARASHAKLAQEPEYTSPFQPTGNPVVEEFNVNRNGLNFFA